ncbi:hypothetical protein DRQ20_00635 [bacterium]|nr:MAG: hypothetical protein DRQ20_00635 [bacterium]
MRILFILKIIHLAIGPTLPVFCIFLGIHQVAIYEFIRRGKSDGFLSSLIYAMAVSYIPLGALGTFLGICEGFKAMSGLDLNGMLYNLFRGTQHAMYSSVVGIIFTLLSYLEDVILDLRILTNQQEE